MKRIATTAGIWAGLLLFSSPLSAVKPVTVKHDQPKQFSGGQLDKVVVSSRGEVTLARASKTLGQLDKKADAVNALARAGDGKIYAATGPNGLIFQIDGEEVNEFAALPDGGTIFSLVFDHQGRLLAGTGGGERARIYCVDGTGKARLFFEPPGAKYVWALARGEKGEIYAATGLEGKLFVIEPDGRNGKVLAEIKKPKNLLCLAFGPDHLLYAGTDEEGLVYRINPADGKAFVLYDAKEPEVSAIVFDDEGDVYAATADAEAARPGRESADKPAGRPEASETQPAQDKPAVTQPGPKKAAMEKTAAKEESKPAKPPVPHNGNKGRAVTAARPPEGGNAIYRIDTEGFVTEVFREPVMILALAEEHGIIHAATGNEGRIFAVDPRQERTAMLCKLESAQVTAMLRLPDGRLFVGTANPVSLAVVATGYASQGTLISEPLDAKQIVKWGRIKWEASIPEGARLTLATRSGNVENKESPAWESWSAELDATSPVQIPSVPARFLQYRLTFQTQVPAATAALRSLQFTRIEENREPELTSLAVLPASEAAKRPDVPPRAKSMLGGEPGPEDTAGSQSDFYWVALWKAEDPNDDPLIFEVFFRQVGETRWVRMAKELREPCRLWDTRTVPDGRYEIRVQASDIKGNPPGTELTAGRISDPIMVDNTPPDITIETVQPRGKKSLSVHAVLSDAASALVEAAYSVDSADKWLPLAADDGIFDSLAESVTFTADDLEAGEHRLTLRVRDERGNTRYVSRSATLGN